MHPASPLLIIYGRNIDMRMFLTGKTASELAPQLQLSVSGLNRIRFARTRYIDPCVLSKLINIFNCNFNDLLTPQLNVVYPGVNFDNLSTSNSTPSIRIDP
jgi:hypothetical protein